VRWLAPRHDAGRAAACASRTSTLAMVMQFGSPWASCGSSARRDACAVTSSATPLSGRSEPRDGRGMAVPRAERAKALYTALEQHKACRGGDRNRTGVQGFAGRRERSLADGDGRKVLVTPLRRISTNQGERRRSRHGRAIAMFYCKSSKTHEGGNLIRRAMLRLLRPAVSRVHAGHVPHLLPWVATDRHGSPLVAWTPDGFRS